MKYIHKGLIRVKELHIQFVIIILYNISIYIINILLVISMISIIVEM